MNRKNFFKKLGIGTVAAVVAPQMLVDKTPVKPQTPVEFDISRIPDGISIEDFIKGWKNSRVLCCKEKNVNEKLIALFEENPEVANVVRDVAKGSSFRETLLKHISI